MLVVDLYFGRDIAGRAPVTDAEWADFAARELTPRFAGGLTVFDTRGQWMDTATKTVRQEASRVVRIALPPGSDVADRIEAVSASYKNRFRQTSVGAVSATECARF